MEPQVACLSVRHLNHYTKLFSVLVWGYKWIIFMIGWFCPIHLIQWIQRKSVHFGKTRLHVQWWGDSKKYKRTCLSILHLQSGRDPKTFGEVLCRNINRFWQMQNHQDILILVSVVYENILLFFFEAYYRNKEIVFQNNIAERYYNIGRSGLHCNI